MHSGSPLVSDLFRKSCLNADIESLKPATVVLQPPYIPSLLCMLVLGGRNKTSHPDGPDTK